MKLKKLFKEIHYIGIHGARDVEITGVSANSKLVSPGNLFIAKRGKTSDGTKYIPEAIAAGCVATVTDLYDPTLPITQVIHPDVGSIEALIAATYYERPSDKLLMFGLTGTNGKTTTSFIIKHLIDHFFGPSGLLGTIEYIIGRHRYKPTHTTPDAPSNHKLLKEMVLQGCRAGIMEVTSHALEQDRIAEIDYDVAIFTNLSQDHLDYHANMDDYAKAKNILFQRLTPTHAKKKFPRFVIANGLDPWTPIILEGTKAPIWTYGIDGSFTLNAKDIKLSRKQTSFTLQFQGKDYPATTPLVGRFNLMNTLAAIGAIACQGFPIEQILEKLKNCPPVRGRLEPVQNPLNFKIYVDFAHTEDALKNVLKTLQEMKKKRLITVFGCGGDRDPYKRPKMAQIVEELSDLAIVTTDNCRSEEPESICRDILKGFTNPDKYFVELDRKEAIFKAVKSMDKDDLLLIAGKGHETQQIFAHQTIEFDDKRVALQACEARLQEEL